eukprot:gene12984-14322_t
MTESVDGHSDTSSISSTWTCDYEDVEDGDNLPKKPGKKICANTIYQHDRDNIDRFIPDVPIKVKITEMVRTPWSHVLSPNLYTIEIVHGSFKWSIKRRYRHFFRLYTELALVKATSKLPITKHEKITCELPKFPKTPEPAVIGAANLERRRKKLQKFLQHLMKLDELRNEREVLDFFEVSIVSFIEDFGVKGKESIVEKKAGGQRVPVGCCSCVRCSACGFWNHRWLALKDSCVLYMNPKTLVVRDVLLMDPKFTVKHGRKSTGSKHGLVISNGARDLSVKCHSTRDTREWITAIVKAMASTGCDWVKDHHNNSFAPIRRDNQVQWFVDAAGYLERVADAIETAEEEIYITDWWLSPELHLKRPIVHETEWRLDQLLKKKADEGVHVYVIMYKEIELTLPINSYYSKQVLQSLHDSNIKVLRHPDHLPGSGTFLWAHHEKVVCIDQKIAFLGGVDLCYGRWDNNKHKLTDFGSARPQMFTSTETHIFNMTKMFVDTEAISAAASAATDPSLPRAAQDQQAIAAADEVDSQKYFIGKDYCNPYLKDVLEVDKPLEDAIDRNVHPRMPWHDIAAVVYGAAARDVARHFIQRWNFTKLEKVKEFETYPLLIPKTYHPVPMIEPLDSSKTVVADCQILRSSGEWSAGVATENSIHEAYIELIKNSKHFIYIENQFFITSIKSEGVYNKIGDALVDRITQAHTNGEKFLITVVMPLLPSFPGEIGQPSGSAKLVVEHWNYRTIIRSPESIFELLKERGVEDPSKYINFYGLRNYADLRDRINDMSAHNVPGYRDSLRAQNVDRRRAVIIGSANINDRSMLGNRDSEIAIIVNDTEMVDSEMNGEPYKAGKFASSIRQQIYREHLGLFRNPEHSVIDPLCDDMVNFWSSSAKENTEIYEEVFRCLPSNHVKSFSELDDYNRLGRLATSDVSAARRRLQQLQGYLVEKPLHFLENQDMRPGTGTPESLVPTSVFT